ncbi:MAG TPA: hypothetical protein VD757_02575 [Candidatus Nitrosocosmicus sp.]|nr:hypothetical protein [Candidatus Nitrosocosmicus sp.]
MKLHYIYILLGTATLILNLALTIHLFRRPKGLKDRKEQQEDGLITFKLSKERSAEGLTTAAVLYDDTVLLED